MPVNKAARFRFEIIDECLRNTARKWSKAELLYFVNRRLELHFGAETNISVSQLRYDMESMQSEYGAPIEMYKDGRNVYYRYEDPTFSIKTIPIDEEDLIKLNDAVQLLGQMKGFTIANEMAEIVKRLESRYKFTNNGATAFISFESVPEMHGVENLEDIYHAVIRGNVLKINYQTFRSKQAKIWHIHPYLLKEYDNRWYLLGFAEETSGIRIFALDRMLDIRVVKKPFIKKEFATEEDFFRDVIGITILTDRKPETVEVMFAGNVAPYIKTKPLHHSQEILKQMEDGSIQVRLRVIPNPELQSILLSYGKDVKVLQPQWLAEEIKNIAASLLEQYQ